MTFQMYVLEEKMASEQLGEQRGLQIGLQQGRTEGLQQGRTEEKEAVALKMIHRGKSHDEIQELTDLPPERIQQLVKETRDSEA